MAALILICRLLTPPAVLSTDSRAQSQSNMRGEPVSRILSRSTPLPAQSWAIIHLGGLLPGPSSCQPEPAGLKRPICGSYLALLPVGLAVPRLLPAARWALPHRFTITLHARLSLLCGAIPRVTPAGRYPAPCLLVSGLSSDPKARGHPAIRASSSLCGSAASVNGKGCLARAKD